VKMQCKGLEVDKDLQWVCCAESFGIFNTFIVKELCIACIQTGEYYTFHIVPGINLWYDLNLNDPLNQEVYKLQMSKHNIDWFDGCFSLKDSFDCMEYFISKNNPIFVVDRQLEQFLITHGFNDVELLKVAPLDSMNSLPTSACQNYGHNQPGFKHCAQRKALEVIHHVGPMLLPFLKPNTFELVDNFLESTIPSPEEKITTYALTDPLYDQLVTLMKNASVCGKLSMAWRNATDDEPTGTFSLVPNPEACDGSESAEQAATAIDNPL